MKRLYKLNYELTSETAQERMKENSTTIPTHVLANNFKDALEAAYTFESEGVALMTCELAEIGNFLIAKEA